MDASLRAALQRALAGRVVEARDVAGGDINRALRARLDDGRSVFVKTHPDPPAGMYAAEARGLGWLGETGALRVPQVLAVGDAFLVLEWLEPGSPAVDFDERLGRGLAALHGAGAPGFGRVSSGPACDGYIGPLPQDDRPCARWGEFWATRRIEPMARRARDAGRLPQRTASRIDRLLGRLDAHLGPDEPPARLHGDLWRGNCLADNAGAPVLIDPAAYGGHREVDLAMMRLFGGFGPRVFAAYAEARPLAPGHEARVPLYQLWPLLVHVVLFGGGYVDSLDAALARLA